MLEKSGGMYGFTKDVSRFATTPRTGQLACFSVGIFVFFDDYANVLLAGETMRPLLDLLYVSREKLSFIVDATSAPIASLSPVSSWVGFEVGLIQTQLDIIVERAGTDDIGIKTSGLGVFLQSIKYRYYPIFMIVLMLGLIYSGRDFGPMLVAERKTQVYERSDGGDGKGVASKNGTSEKHNAPKEGTPLKSWNMVFPVLVLVSRFKGKRSVVSLYHAHCITHELVDRFFSFFTCSSKRVRNRGPAKASWTRLKTPTRIRPCFGVPWQP
jgi:Na+/H+ antiporter NhaC